MLWTQQKYYIAISHAPSQPNETQWLKELGFKQLEMGDGLVLSSMDYFWSLLRNNGKGNSVLVKPLAGNCSARVVYNLGTAHDWRDKVITYETFEDFKAAMDKKITGGSYEENLTYIATTYSHSYGEQYNEAYGGQYNEEKWLEKLGFKQILLGNISVWATTFYDYKEHNS